MDILIKCAGFTIISVIFGLSIDKKEFGLILTIITCTIIGFVAFTQIQPIFELMSEITRLGNIRSDFLSVLIKSTGIALISDFAGTVCSDCGNGSVGKMLHFCGRILILNLSTPVIRSLLVILQEMLQNI